MLSRPETEDMALYALERIPSEEASEVLLDALSDVEGILKVGIINALGNRQEKEAVKNISPLIWDLDGELAYAAIAATGKIGGDEAAEALAKAVTDPNVSLKSEAIQAYLKCAAEYEDRGVNHKALEIYQSLNQPAFDPQVRHAAVRGIIQTSGQKATDVIVAFFDNENPDNYAIVIPLCQEIPDSENVSPIVAYLLKMQSADQRKLISALAGRKNPDLVKAMEKLVESSDEQLRIAALNALSLSGDAETALLFAGIAAGTKGLERSTARNCLDRLNAPGTDKLIINSIPVSDDARKIELIRSTSSRYISNASSLIVDELQSPNSDVRIASIKALKDIGSPEQLNTLISYHLNATNNDEVRELENTIVAVSKRIPDTQSQAAFLLSNMDKLNDDKIKSSYLEMMGKIGDPKSLPVLRTALKGTNDALRTSAIRGLSDWPDLEPADDLLNIAKSSENKIHRALAFRGYVDLLIRDKSLDWDTKTEMYETSMKLAETATEKRQVLSGLVKNPTLKGLQFVLPYLDDPEVKDESEITVLRISRRLAEDYPQDIMPVLKKVKAQTTNEEIIEQINELISEIKEN
jgi:HEAT repeat protein